MTAPTVSDDEFIALWQELKSPSKMAAKLGLDVRSIYQRRRNVEVRYGILLESGSDNPIVSLHDANINIGIDNGIAVVFSDAHYWPGIVTTAHRALLHFIKQMKPRLIICNGDAFDGASISRFPRIGWDKKPSLIQELHACQERLTEITDAGKGAKFVWPLGNHDARFENRLAQNAPEFEGISGFHLKDHFPEWHPCWAAWVNGDTVIKHRWKGGIHAAHNNTVGGGVNFVTGHLHSLKVTPYTDYNGTRYGVDTGTLADIDGPQFIDYTEAGPSTGGQALQY